MTVEAAAAPARAPAASVFLRIPDVHLYQVVDMQYTYLCSDVLQIQTYQHDTSHIFHAVVGQYSWLLAKHIPALRSSTNMLVFGVEGYPNFFFCVMLPPGLAPEAETALLGLLQGATHYQDQVPPPLPPSQPPQAAVAEPPPQPSGSSATRIVAKTLVKGGELLAVGVVVAGTMAAAGIAKASEYTISKSSPAPQPTHVSPQTQSMLDTTRKVSSTTAKVAKSVAKGVVAVGSQAAACVAKGLSNTSMGKSVGGSGSVQAAQQVGVAGLQAAGCVFDAMYAASKVVMDASKEHGSRVVEHKYGPEAAQASRQSVGVAADVMKACYAMRSLMPTVLMKQVAEDTAKHMVRGEQQKPASH